MGILVKTFLFITASIGSILFFLFGLAKGNFLMAGLGLVLAIIGPTVFLFAIFLLPDRWFNWFKAREITTGYEETLDRRSKIQMIAVPLIMLLGIGSCVAGNMWAGMILFWFVSTVTFMAITFAPNRWFSSRPDSRFDPAHRQGLASDKTIEPKSAQNAAYGGKHRPERRQLVKEFTQTGSQDTPELASLRDQPPVSDKETARRIAHNDAYATSDPVATAAMSRSKRIQLLNRLRNMTPEQFKSEYTAKEDQADWMKNRWAYWQIARELEEAERKNAHDTREREKAARKRAPEAIATQKSTPDSAEPTTGRPYVVYFIREKEDDGKCKVGVTYSLESRLRSLQTGNPHELEAVHTIKVSSKAAAEQIEEAVLNAVRNAGAEMKGEWFQSAILPWAKQVAETERKRMESELF